MNENDTVSVEQIRFGDNDTLAALGGLPRRCRPHGRSSRISTGCTRRTRRSIRRPRSFPSWIASAATFVAAAGARCPAVGSGGMIHEDQGGRVLMAAGIPMVICQGGARTASFGPAAGAEQSARCSRQPASPHEITRPKLWIALGDSVHGTVVVDEGARDALVMRGKSLLSVGIRAVEGDFGLMTSWTWPTRRGTCSRAGPCRGGERPSEAGLHGASWRGGGEQRVSWPCWPTAPSSIATNWFYRMGEAHDFGRGSARDWRNSQRRRA
ncbi:MAG: hypothetical protein ACLTDR_07495 [Adlercreutzia equolifaciens]